MHESYDIAGTRVDLHRAWTRQEVVDAIEAILEARASALPERRDARIVIKPNLNNDLVALTGNCVDLRVLWALVRGLQRRGYTDITVADGSNVGIDRRSIDSFARLRVDRLCEVLGVRLVNLNGDTGRRLVLHAGGEPLVADTILDQDFLISVPKIKTHAEMQLTCAMKNWVGIVVGQDKRQVHYDLGLNIYALNELVRPDLVIVDGLVGMEGNGPGDGVPFRMGVLVACDDALVNDLVVATMVGMPWRRVAYLAHALDRGRVSPAVERAIREQVPELRRIEPPPPRSLQAKLSEKRWLIWLKLAVRPLVDKPQVARLAYKLRITQDVYDWSEDTLRIVGRAAERCGDCDKCQHFCPTGLPLEAIGRDTDPPACIHCLYCWLVCPREAILVEGEPHHLERQVSRYGEIIRDL
jgi:uncharacterized protein (DUF362 family)/ferredoxin